MNAIPKPRRVALFITCIIDNFFPDVGDASVELIERAGTTVDFPPDQMCCGQPGYNGGFQADARAVAAGATIVIDIADQPYGGRGYACKDPEGHYWWFGSYDPWAEQSPS